MITITLEEGDRQAVILALAKLSMERPGWCVMLEGIALKMDNARPDGRPEMFEHFRQIWTAPMVSVLEAESAGLVIRDFPVSAPESLVAFQQTAETPLASASGHPSTGQGASPEATP